MSPPPDMPGFDGQRPEGGQMSPPPDMPDFGGQRPVGDASPTEQAVAEEEAAAEESAAFVPTAQTWILLALSLLALTGGLVLAVRFEP